MPFLYDLIFQVIALHAKVMKRGKRQHTLHGIFNFHTIPQNTSIKQQNNVCMLIVAALPFYTLYLVPCYPKFQYLSDMILQYFGNEVCNQGSADKTTNRTYMNISKTLR